MYYFEPIAGSVMLGEMHPVLSKDADINKKQMKTFILSGKEFDKCTDIVHKRRKEGGALSQLKVLCEDARNFLQLLREHSMG
ncbi:hypothetical protein POVCU1_020080 [Plasmodium ovale curtisi]|uniref:Uncharacterized protein n=1 Tax=Plasmodium ovale curtisi TaxID=864141 RepID=A0A1A8WHC4_PLAOA|nr:hypothetical protein POVCU1_020080 [Plasmodium ovale curtisi]